jgi:4'-phosphopantetheinyl transferase
MRVTAPTCDMSAEKVETALFPLDLPADALGAHYRNLDPGERASAAAFRFDRDRQRFIARRGQLRARLARETGEHPQKLRIEVDANGKPLLPDYRHLHFNLSHSRGLALLAIGRGVPVGCDMEWRNPELAGRDVAARFFTEGECDDLAALPDRRWVEGFFNCWTRKEAYVKALGRGLSYPLDAFRVSVEDPACFIEALPDWTLSSFEPAPGYQAALVVGIA